MRPGYTLRILTDCEDPHRAQRGGTVRKSPVRASVLAGWLRAVGRSRSSDDAVLAVDEQAGRLKGSPRHLCSRAKE
jgi:hypothetical protein